MENNVTIRREQVLFKTIKSITDQGDITYYIIYFNDDNILDVYETKKDLWYCNWNCSLDWSIRLNVSQEAVRQVMFNYMSYHDSYEKFEKTVRAYDEILNENKAKLQAIIDEHLGYMIEREERAKRERLLRIEQKKDEEREKAFKLAQAEELRKERERKEKTKTLSIEDVVGVCKFEFISKPSDKKGEKILDMVKTNFLVCETYEFEDLAKIQKEILSEVAKRLAEKKRFKSYQIPIGCFKAKMFFRKNPKSINVIFTLKDELV